VTTGVISGAGPRVHRSVFPEALLVVGLAVLVAWVVRGLAPPSLVRDGRRLPVAMSGQHAAGHHGGGELVPPSPVSDEPLANFLGQAFLAAHVLAILLLAGTRLVRRFRWGVGRIAFAVLAAAAAGVAAVLTARMSYQDGIGLGDALAGGAEVARYTLVVGLLFGANRERAREA
jgi:hypothetical protein